MTGMHLAYSPEQDALREELRTYYGRLDTGDLVSGISHHRGVGPRLRRVVRQMGEDGWLGIGWPTEYGGQGRSAIDQFVFFDESMRAGAAIPMLSINTVAPTLMQFGSPEQKDAYLPPILRGEIQFCIGYTEPNAGTDLAALRTTAIRDGNEYIVNGQKVFTSLIHDADYIWLAVRTGDSSSRHKGLSILIVPVDTPGITIEPMNLIVDHDICHVFYDDVRVPVANLVGGESQGWTVITSQLNHERVTMCSPGIVERALAEVTAWAAETILPDGQPVIAQEWVQLNLARVHTGLDFLRLINWKVAWSDTVGELDIAEVSTTKVFGTEFYLEAFRLLLEILGEPGAVRGPDSEVLGGHLENLYRNMVMLTFAGGTNEVQRDLIALFGLGLPIAKR